MTQCLPGVCRWQESFWILGMAFESKVKVKILNLWLNGVSLKYFNVGGSYFAHGWLMVCSSHFCRTSNMTFDSKVKVKILQKICILACNANIFD